MTTISLQRAALACALLAAVASSHASASGATASPALRHGDHGIEITTERTAPAWQLRLVGPGGVAGTEFVLSDETLLLRPSLLRMPAWVDGGYHFELSPVLGDRQRRDGERATASVSPAPALRGGFSVLGGRVHLPAADAKEAPGTRAGRVRPLDQTIPDDMIIQGSLCVGFDCVDGESFGFDTVRLKENNLRLRFEDSSVSAGFASNDWQLVANGDGAGGADFFAIEDATAGRRPLTVAGGAPDAALFVAGTSGNIGFGTSTPLTELHAVDSDTPVVRLEQDSTGGYTAQTWDIGGNEANFFVREPASGLMPLRVRPGAPTSSIDVVRNGDVGFGTLAPQAALHVDRAAGDVALRLETGPAHAAWNVVHVANSGRLVFTDDPARVRAPLKLGAGAADNLLRVGAPAANTVQVNGDLDVNGSIFVSGSVGPDYVFAPGFRIPSIAEHATSMWAARHLPKVGPARVENGEGVIDLAAISHGMLEELEYAHVYIAELDGTVQALKQELSARDAELQALRDEVRAIREALAD